MSFELIVAVKRDPSERDGVAGGAPRSRASYTSIALNGVATSAAAREVLGTISELFDEGTECIIVELQTIEASDPSGLQTLAEGIMAIRAANRQVQILAHAPALHERMLLMPDARDWLMTSAETGAGGARRSIHLDGDASVS
jgi:anti-anti-sigma regulatory factor